jgi:hypothetical protein
MASKPVFAWHFLKASGKLDYRDGRKVVQGEKMRFKERGYGDKPLLCRQGMHASKSVAHAAKYNNNRPILTRVILEGQFDDTPKKAVWNKDKMAAEYRTAVAGFDTRKKEFTNDLRRVMEQHIPSVTIFSWMSGQTILREFSYSIQKNRKARDAVRRLCMKYCKLERNTI